MISLMNHSNKFIAYELIYYEIPHFILYDVHEVFLLCEISHGKFLKILFCRGIFRNPASFNTSR